MDLNTLGAVLLIPAVATIGVMIEAWFDRRRKSREWIAHAQAMGWLPPEHR